MNTMKKLPIVLLLCLSGCGASTRVVSPDPPIGNVPVTNFNKKTTTTNEPIATTAPHGLWMVLWLTSVGLATLATVRTFKNTKTS